VALLAAISTVLYYVSEIPIIPGVEHLKLDFSAIPSFIASVMLGPSAGVLVELVKNLLHLPKSTTLGIGELVSFIVGSSMVLGFSLTLRSLKRRAALVTSYIAAFAVGLVCATVVGWICNYAFTPLFFSQVLHAPLKHEALMAMVWSSTTLNVVKSCISILPVLATAKRLFPEGSNLIDKS
jgi:riboflavin transporter FmnP